MEPGRSRKRTTESVLTAVAVGLAVSMISAALLVSPVNFVEVLQLSVSDFLFIREGGPLLGVRPPRSDMVLVLWDPRSRQQMGTPFPSLDQDLQLYESLTHAGARVIADTRLLFADTPGLQEFMGRLVSLDPNGAVLRDADLGRVDWFVQQQEAFQRHLAHSPLLDPSVSDITQFVRYYPLLVFDPVEGFNETMAVKVARAMLERPGPARTRIGPEEGGAAMWTRPMLEAPAPASMEQVWQESGIAAIWAKASRLATQETLPPGVAEAGVNPRPYRLSPDRQIQWVTPPNDPRPYLVSPAAVWINYTGPSPGYSSASYVDALQAGPGSFSGKAVLVGYDLTVDPFPSPVSGSKRMDRSEIVAQAAQTIIDGRFIERPPATVSAAVAALFGLVGAALVALFRPLRGSFAAVLVLVMFLAAAAFLYRSATLADVVVAPTALISAGVLVGGYEYVREERARRRIADLFGRYVPRAVVASVIERSEEQTEALGGVTRDITVLFADIRGFTAFSEDFAPQEVLSQLNGLLQVMVECAFRHEGTVDKYIGDAIMVLFNAPLDQADHVERAVRTALDMQRAMASHGGDLGFGIGIHCGEAVVGTVGTRLRMEYTAIGATVNLASRLCDTAKRGEVVVSDEVYRRLEGRVVGEARPPIRVKNIDRDLLTYVVTELRGASISPL